MKILLLLALAALSNADVSHLSGGYQYNNPASQSSYGAPQGSVVGHGSVPSVNFVQYSQQQQQPSNAYQFSSQYSQTTGSGSPSLSSFNVGASPSQGNSGFGFNGQSSTVSNGASFDFGAGASQGSSGFGSGAASGVNGQSSIASNGAAFDFGAHANQGSSGSGFGLGQTGGASFNFGAHQQNSGLGGISAYQGQTSGGSIDESFGVVTDAAAGASASAAADVSKHLYFFSAPEQEDEVIEAKYDLPAVPAKKTYKIIFIKAPAYKNQGTIVVPPPPQNEEKTLVYVLVKKPEGQPKIHFKEAAPTQPTKPEVFFIKYKTQKEAENAVAEIQNKHGATGQVIANLPAGTQAAFQSPDGSIVHNPSSVDIGSLSGIGLSGGAASLTSVGTGFGATATSGSFSLDSLGANTATIDSRIGGQQTSVEQNSEGGVNVQVTADQGLVSQSPTPASFGQSAVDSLSGFTLSTVIASGTSGAETVPENSEEFTTVENTAASQDCCSGNVASADNDVQGSTGFSEYGVPKNRRFARNFKKY
ncbi:unnamed protein product [Ceutorhynchus assimilis]|uniref:DUF243 domain-containing protein n=1 Tax=Ceutorhynchus assimilis TaxID=467358 RepID=A0A9N9N120_9CUCU|nr:unnamed protein product [Ceutorhynchus assimilis]